MNNVSLIPLTVVKPIKLNIVLIPTNNDVNWLKMKTKSGLIILLLCMLLQFSLNANPGFVQLKTTIDIYRFEHPLGYSFGGA